MAEDPEYKIDLAVAKTKLPIPDGGKAAPQNTDEPVGQLTVDIYHTMDDIFVNRPLPARNRKILM